MLRQVLKQEFVHSQMGQLATKADAPKHTLPDEDPPRPEQLEEIRRMLAEAAVAPDRHLDVEHPAPSGPDGEVVPPLSDTSYFSRDALTSLVQSAIEEYYEEHESEEIVEPEEPDVQGFAADEAPLPDPVTDRRLNIPGEQDEFLGKYEITDPGWVNSVVAMGWRRLHGRHPFKDEPAEPKRLEPDARIVLVADWGSGIPRARNVAKEMRKIIEPDIGKRDQHVIHLGDVYYSGWKREYQKNFLDCWPVRDGEKVGSWSLNGNHDMYSGGHGYFGYLLADARFADQQRSSWFSLENDDWQFLGLDTAYEEHGLIDPQGEWVAGKIAEHESRMTVLMSHHQLFSAYGSQGPDIRKKLETPLAANAIDAWFWGHEHRCVFYKDDHDGVGKARLIGHGGVPVYAHHEAPGGFVERQFTDSFPTAWEEWALMGFAVIELSGREAKVRYIDEFGRQHDEETLRPRVAA